MDARVGNLGYVFVGAVMKQDNFNYRVGLLEERIKLLEQWSRREGTGELTREMVAELHTSLEELLVMDEELRQQNEELTAVHQELITQRRRYQELFEFAPDGYLVTDRRGVIYEANHAAAALLNTPPRLLAGKPLMLYIAQKDQPAFYHRLHALQQRRLSRLEWQATIRPYERSGFLAAITVAASDNPVDEWAFRWLLRDINEQQQAQTEREQLLAQVGEERDKLQTLIHSMTDEVWFCDARGRLAMVNQTARYGLGIDVGPYLLQPLTACLEKVEIYTLDGRRQPPVDSPLLRALNGETVDQVEELALHQETEQLRCRQTSAAPLTSDGRIIGAVAVVRDITEHKQAELALRSAYDALEKQVRQKTAELAYTSATLAEQNEERTRVEAEIERRNQEVAALRQAYDLLGDQIRERTAELGRINADLREQKRKRKKAERQVNRRNLELAALNTLITAVSSSLELREVLWTLRNLLSQKLGIPGGAALFYDETADQLYLKASWGLPPALLAELALLPVADSYYEPIVREKAALLKEDFRQAPHLIAWELDKNRPEWQSHLAVPLISHGEVQGVLLLFSQAPTRFGGQHIAFYKNLGRQVGTAVQNARLFAEVRDSQEQLRRLAQQVVLAQEEERHRVSRELHDEAGQALTVLKFSLAMVLAELEAMETADEAGQSALTLSQARFDSLQRQLLEATALSETAMERIRTVAHDLRPAALDDLGLVPALEGLCHDFAGRTHLAVSYQGMDEAPALDEPAELCLYRFLQEALTNVVKHAQAQTVAVRLTCDAQMVELSVTDDGQGFEPEENLARLREADGMGLAGMHERLRLLNGWLEIHSLPDEGTRLTAYLPYEGASASY
jgi:PAS domain S-box-containing protein